MPVGALQAVRARRVVDAFLVRAADDRVHHHDRADALDLEESQDDACGAVVIADVSGVRVPALEIFDFTVLDGDECDRDLRGDAIVWAVEGDRREGVVGGGTLCA